MRRAAFLALLLAGCGLVPDDPGADLAEAPLVSDCEPPLAFEGETTLAELGVLDAEQERSFGAQAIRRGVIRITRDTIRWDQFAPPDAPAVVPAGQMLCATWEDGSGMSMLLPEPFPAGENRSSNEAELPVAAIVLVVGVLLVGGLSWVLFRSEPRASA